MSTISQLLQPAGPTGGNTAIKPIQGSKNTVQVTAPTSTFQPAASASQLNATNTSSIPLYTSSQQQAPSAPEPVVDPWASTPWGSYSAYQNAVNGYNEAKNTMNSSVNDAITNSGNQYKSGILDFLDQLTAGQKSIDRTAINAELGREQGRYGVMDMVGTGIRSGGVMLNNNNATNSSAAEAMARAWGELGRKEMSKVGNKYVLDQNNVKAQQEQLDAGTATFRRHAEENKTTIANGIVSDAAQKIAQLNMLASSSSLPDQLNIESEKERIRQQALAALAQFDVLLSDGVSKTKASTTESNRAEAYKLLNAGVAPEDIFAYTTTVPQDLVGTGPFSSSLPLFTGA